MLTLHQPWASLIAVGAKTIETRGWSTDYRGPLAIHAGARRVHHGKFLLLARTALNKGLISREQEKPFRSIDVPFGAVVAVCDLVDVVPILNPHLHEPPALDPCVWSTPRQEVPRSLASETLVLDVNPSTDSIGDLHDVTDQLPFGDFTPGRYAWLLDNVRPVDPIPCKGTRRFGPCPVSVPA